MDVLTYIQGRTKCSLDIINALLEITVAKQRKREDTAISWKEVRTLFKQRNYKNSETTKTAKPLQTPLFITCTVDAETS